MTTMASLCLLLGGPADIHADLAGFSRYAFLASYFTQEGP